MKYHWQDVRSTTPYPNLPYTQRLSRPISLSIGACAGFLTGARWRAGKTFIYYIRGLYIRRPLKVRGTYSVYAEYVHLLDLSKEDRDTFQRELKQREEYQTYLDIRERSTR